jgi:hypothetical protein
VKYIFVKFESPGKFLVLAQGYTIFVVNKFFAMPESMDPHIL